MIQANYQASDDYDINSFQDSQLFKGKLKGYQLHGLNWLINLYNHAINGILAGKI